MLGAATCSCAMMPLCRLSWVRNQKMSVTVGKSLKLKQTSSLSAQVTCWHGIQTGIEPLLAPLRARPHNDFLVCLADINLHLSSSHQLKWDKPNRTVSLRTAVFVKHLLSYNSRRAELSRSWHFCESDIKGFWKDPFHSTQALFCI